jgi:arylsulfatase A-like enzyme
LTFGHAAAALALLALFPFGCAEERAGKTARSDLNVLLVTLDTTRADHFGSYGYERDTTPHFDTLAEDGVLFELAISTSAITPTAHASILSGLNPYQHGVRVIYAGSGYRLPPQIPTLASVLHENGWETGAFLSAFTVSEHYGFERGFDIFDNGLANPSGSVLQQRQTGAAVWDVAENQRRSDATTDAATAWLQDRERPFFAWIHYWDPHDSEVLPPEEVRARFAPSPGGEVQPVLDIYDSELFYVDRQFGRVVRTLEQIGAYDDTVIVVVSDHGEGLGDHDWMHHRLLYQEQIHVPLILRIPEGPRARRVPGLVRVIDVYPTILEILGLEPPRPVQGRSLLSLVAGATEEPRLAYADQLNQWDANAAMVGSRPLDRLLYCATDGTWKLIYRATDPARSELFNLQRDPRERNNLFHATHPQYLRLKRALDAFDGYRWRRFSRDELDSEVLERLRSLGYDDGQPTAATP